MPQDSNIVQSLAQTGQAVSITELQQLVSAFEAVLKRFGISIQSGSELEGACYSVLDVLGKNQNSHLIDPQADIRVKYTDVLGIWTFLKKIVRLEGHASFPSFQPHLKKLNNGTVGQNKRAPVCQEATNKIFELLFALALLDVSDEVILDHLDLAKGDNPDVLATIDGQCWGFACKTFYDNLKKGVEQIEAAPKAQLGIVVMNLRNIIRHEESWPILNEAEYRTGEEPIFAAYKLPEAFVASHINELVTQKRDQVVAETKPLNVMDLFAGKKALPAFLAFCQTCIGVWNELDGPSPMLINMLKISYFSDAQAHQGVFDKIDLALKR